MDLVDEEDVALRERREDAREIALALERGPRGHLDLRAHFVGEQVGERRLAEPGRPVEEHVIERLGALPRRRNRDLQVLAHAILADVVIDRARAQPRFILRVLVGAHRSHNAVVR